MLIAHFSSFRRYVESDTHEHTKYSWNNRPHTFCIQAYIYGWHGGIWVAGRPRSQCKGIVSLDISYISLLQPPYRFREISRNVFLAYLRCHCHHICTAPTCSLPWAYHFHLGPLRFPQDQLVGGTQSSHRHCRDMRVLNGLMREA